MTHSWKYASALLSVLLLFSFSGLYPRRAYGTAGYCSSNTAEPPFLAMGEDPNLLLVIDNSASMYDLAYVEGQGYCYDDSYASATTYAGYFKPGTWYAYDFGAGRFEPKTDAEATTLCGSATYKNSDVCITIDATPSVTMFAAKGNFLNWATASKLDIEKEILTGGKYDSTNSRLVLESRGCLDRRFVKKVAVEDSSFNPFYLTLGVRPPTDDEKAGASDDTTRIEIFNVTADGFENEACQSAIEELSSESPNQGDIKQYIQDCMGYHPSDQELRDSMAAFSHSIHNCWYVSKHGVWPPGAGPVQSIKGDCEKIYEAPVDPGAITPDNRGYVCYGVYNADPALREGYVGRCWDPNIPGWIADGDACIEQALQAYCGVLDVPEVIDPSDQAGETGEFWNIPAVLIDSGVIAQLGDPLRVIKGHIAQSGAPTGIIQEFADDVRIGAMIFNDNGSTAECAANPNIACPPGDNRDGGKIISYIDQSGSHTTALVSAINDIKATSWTPVAEALYNAIGYYTQNSALRLDPADFLIDAAHDPITNWCQLNNILIITDGASSADLNSAVSTFASSDGHNDGDAADTGVCGSLSGSTLLDDLAYYAKQGSGIYPVDTFTDGSKNNITTYIVVAGALRITGIDECSPDVLLNSAAQSGGTALYSAEGLSGLEGELREVFSTIRTDATSGSAATVISSSRGGEGAIYQAIFWPTVLVPNGNPVVWTGEVHALFLDSEGKMREDTNGDRALDSGDERVIFYYDEGTGNTEACYGELNADGTCNGTSKSTEQVHFLWSAVEWLANISDANILVNRSTFISNEPKRYIFTWNDLDNDGVVDSSEVLDFEAKGDWVSSPLSVSGGRGPIPLDFGVQTSAEVDEIVKWVRGLDQAGMRGRQVETDFDLDGTPSTVTWRLGDIIHSTPMVVANPSEGYHLIYRDFSYAEFVAQYKNRRHAIYFGGNDGMLHALNGGFYKSDQKRFCRNEDCSDEGATPVSSPELGAELWAYVPYNLLPHLQCMTDPGYMHMYFVDLRPRLFDVRIFPDDSVHPGGWGTILVGGMRFGGAKIRPGELDLDSSGAADYPADTRELTSAYFILDVTNPEEPPVLLGELTGSDLGYTTVIPTVVPMKDGANTTWYLILGSGPTELDGRSTQTAKVAVLPLDWLVGTPRAFRIPDALPASPDEGGCFTLSANSFVSDLITVDFDLEEDYKADVVYFGTVEGGWGSWGGRLYRLVTEKEDVDGNQVVTKPSDWATLLAASSLTNPITLIDVGQPITAAPTIGTDGENYWAYFGTGRFFDADDKTDGSSNAQQTYYGIKEPQDSDGKFTWETVEKTGTYNGTPGSRGLLRVDQILVHEAGTAAGADLSCQGGGTGCLPAGVSSFEGLVNYIAGTDGWYKNFLEPRERSLGQAVLIGGLLTFSTYQPFDDLCLSEGLAYLYGVYYLTGTAWHEAVFTGGGDTGLDEAGNVIERVGPHLGMVTTPNIHVGKEEGSKAFVQTSTGTIVEIPQPNIPQKDIKTGRASWDEVTK